MTLTASASDSALMSCPPYKLMFYYYNHHHHHHHHHCHVIVIRTNSKLSVVCWANVNDISAVSTIAQHKTFKLLFVVACLESPQQVSDQWFSDTTIKSYLSITSCCNWHRLQMNNSISSHAGHNCTTFTIIYWKWVPLKSKRFYYCMSAYGLNK